MMRFSDRTTVVGVILAYIFGCFMTEGNLQATSSSTLFWLYAVGSLWIYLVAVDVKRRCKYMEKRKEMHREVYHV